MPQRRRRWRLWAQLARGAALVLALACSQGAPRPTAARLEALKPSVQVRLSGEELEVAGLEQLALHEGDVVKTLAEGETDVVFAGNNRIHLGPNASLLIEGGGAKGAELGAAVLTGAVTVAAGGAGIGMHIRSPLGLAHLSGASVSVLDVSIAQGMAVRVGQIALESPHANHAITLEVGQAVTFAHAGRAQGLVIHSVGASAELAPIDVAAPREPWVRAKTVKGPVRWRAAGHEAWMPVVANAAFAAGDRVRLQERATAQLQVGAQGSLSLDGNNELTLGARTVSPGAEQLRYALHGGHIRLRVACASQRATHVLEVADETLTIATGPQQADVAVAHRGAQTDVVVRFGTCVLGDGRTVHAGQAVTLQNGHADTEPADAFAGAVAVERRRPSVIYYQHTPPPVRFIGSAHTEAAPTVRFAADARLRRDAKEELLHQGSFLTDAVGGGRTYWRLGSKGRAQAVDVVLEPQRATGDASRNVDLDDTGQPATVIYDNAVPNLVLHWPAIEAASQYRVRFGPDDRSGIVLVEETLQATQLKVPAKALKEGAYAWQVQPRDAAGARLGEAAVNQVMLSFATQARGLRLHAPASDVTTEAAMFTIEGDVEDGCELLLNGARVEISPHGHVKKRSPLAIGKNAFVFRLVKRGRADRVYVRTVTREA